LNVESIKKAVIEVLENPKYYQNAQRRSRFFRDQPEKPLDRTIFWIEWVMRHANEYSLLQLPIIDLSAVVSRSYDVLGFLLAVFVFILTIISYLAKKIFSMREIGNVCHLKQKKH